jgi:hypothetical protein
MANPALAKIRRFDTLPVMFSLSASSRLMLYSPRKMTFLGLRWTISVCWPCFDIVDKGWVIV